MRILENCRQAYAVSGVHANKIIPQISAKISSVSLKYL